MVKDLVYAMAVSPQDSMARSESQDRRYQFCGRGWQAAFEQSHERYLNLAALLERLGGITDLAQTGYAETSQQLANWAERLHEARDHRSGERALVDVQTRICGSELWLG